jgi:hypothetical protein
MGTRKEIRRMRQDAVRKPGKGRLVWDRRWPMGDAGCMEENLLAQGRLKGWKDAGWLIGNTGFILQLHRLIKARQVLRECRRIRRQIVFDLNLK